MSIRNAPHRKLLNIAMFEKNANLTKIIETHNKYIALFSPGMKTTQDMELAVVLNAGSTQFYNNIENKKIIEICLSIQAQLEDINEVKRLSVLKDNYWANFHFTFEQQLSTGLLTTLAIATTIIALVPPAIPAMLVIPAYLIVCALALVAKAFIIAYKDQQKAKVQVDVLTKTFNIPYEQKGPNKYSFFDNRKNELEQEIEKLDPKTISMK